MTFFFEHLKYPVPLSHLKEIGGTITLDEDYLTSTWRGRGICILKAASHAFCAVIYPVAYLIATLFSILSASFHTIFCCAGLGQARERWQDAFSYAASAVVSPLTEAILCVRAAAGVIFHPRAYFARGFPWIACCDHYLQQRSLTAVEHWTLTQRFFPTVIDSNEAILVNARILLEGGIAHAFQALKEDGTSFVDDERKVIILQTWVEAAIHCSPRWYEDIYRVWAGLNMPPAAQRLDYLVQIVVNDLLREFITLNLAQHVNSVNIYRRLFSVELRMLIGRGFAADLETANQDWYISDRILQENKIPHLRNFLQHRCTPQRFLQYMKAFINGEDHLDFRQHWLNQQNELHPEIEDYAPNHYLENFHRQQRNEFPVKLSLNKALALNDAGIRLCLQPQLEYLNTLRTQVGLLANESQSPLQELSRWGRIARDFRLQANVLFENIE